VALQSQTRFGHLPLSTLKINVALPPQAYRAA
jgi:hypothetical protein